MEKDYLTKTCPYCGRDMEWDPFDDEAHVQTSDDSVCAVKCNHCGKIVDVEEEEGAMKFVLTPKGLMTVILHNHELPDPIDNDVVTYFMDNMVAQGYLRGSVTREIKPLEKMNPVEIMGQALYRDKIISDPAVTIVQQIYDEFWESMKRAEYIVDKAESGVNEI